MTAEHNHAPVCCCVFQPEDPCPACPKHGELARLGNAYGQCAHFWGWDEATETERCTRCHTPRSSAEYPCCHQTIGRPHTDYCLNPRSEHTQCIPMCAHRANPAEPHSADCPASP